MRDYDVCILGGGVAGLACARALCGRKRVALVANRAVGSPKPCGGLLAQDAIDYLDGLPKPFAFLCEAGVVAADIWLDGSLYQNKYFNIRREALELSLYESAKSGVDLFISRTYAVEPRADGFVVSGEPELSCANLVVADGVRSANRERFGYPAANTIATEQLFVAGTTKKALFMRDRAVSEEYYYWVIPKDGVTLVGYKLEDRERVQGSVREWFPALSLDAPLRRERYPLTRLLDAGEVLLGRGNLLFIGEAAGLVMPSSGEGIGPALESAAHAATALIERPAAPLPAYAELMEERMRRIEQDLKMNKRSKPPKRAPQSSKAAAARRSSPRPPIKRRGAH